ncbi:MAG: hypothetical protein GEU71_12570 [Actinobacteria bacterium]|nr:hypothetical protein [Actinomycetota bacterium]
MSAESTIVHELAGLLSGVWSFAEIVESRPDHPEREAFISLLRDESKKAAQTMRDFQLLRSIESGRGGEAAGPVWLGELFAGAAAASDHPELLDHLASGVADDAPAVLADPGALGGLLVRLVDVSDEVCDGKSSMTLHQTTRGVELHLDCGSVPPSEVVVGIQQGEGRMRVLYLARRLVESWGGKVTTKNDGDHAVAVLHLTSRTSVQSLEVAG